MPIRIQPLFGEVTKSSVAHRFPRPTDGELSFDTQSRVPEYVPFVVKVLRVEGSSLFFNPVDAADGSVVEEEFHVDLKDMEHVWQNLPSTLAPDPEDSANDTALLFLTEKYISQQAAQKKNRLIAAKPEVLGPCTKWPCYKGVFALEIDRLKRDKAKLEQENAKLQKENQQLLSSQAEIRDKWNRLKEEVSQHFDSVHGKDS